MGTLSRTFSGTCTSADGYWTRNSSKDFGVSSDTGAISGATIQSATLTISNFKSYSDGNTYWVIYDQNGSQIASTVQTLSSNSNMHSESYDLEDLTNALISGSITSVSIQAYSSVNGNKAYAYRGSTSFSITATCEYSEPSAPSTVTLNGTAGNIHIPGGNTVTLAWSGASAGTLNPITGYQVYKNGSAYGSSTTSTSMTVDSPSAGAGITYSVVTLGSRSNSGSSVSRTAYGYSSPSAPTSVKVNGSDSITTDAGASVTLSWSGASNGAGNSITGYTIFRATSSGGSYSSIGTTTGTSYTVTAHATMGSSYYYKVRSNGTYSNSGQSSAYASITSRVYSTVGAPTTVTVSPTVTSGGSSATLSWSAGSAGTNVSVASYTVYRSSNSSSGYTAIASGITSRSYSVQAPTTGGASYYYKIKSIANKSGYDSGLSSAYATLSSFVAPNAPIIQTGAGGKIYNPRPRILVTVPSLSVAGATQTISISGFTASSTQCVSGAKVLLRKATAYSEATKQTVTVTNTTSYGQSTSANATIDYEVPTWTDDPIVTGTTVLKAAHINELRDALDNICTYYGIAQTNWEETITAGVTADINWPSHVAEIQETITRIANYVNSWDTTSATNRIVLPSMKTAYRPSAAVMNQLRDIILLL